MDIKIWRVKMVKYTLVFAKKILRLFPSMNSVWQISNGMVILSTAENRDILELSTCFKSHDGCCQYYLPVMVEYKNGWNQSKVTREDL